MSSPNDTSPRLNGDGKNLGTPIEKIPDEVLALIFVHFDHRLSLPDNEPTPHILSSVNRRWRRVAIDISSLWSHIILSFGEFVTSPTYVERPKLWIERSRTSPLDISIDFSDMAFAPDDIKNHFLDLVLRDVDRWMYVDVIGGWAEDILKFFIALNRTEAPLLREAVFVSRTMMSVRMEDMGDEFDPRHQALLRGSPLLRSVRLIGISHFSTISLRNLTSLDLRNQSDLNFGLKYENLCNLIAASPDLKHLILHSLDFFIGDDIDLAAPIVAKSLKSLSINFRPIRRLRSTYSLFNFLSLLCAPALEEMELIHMEPWEIRELPDHISKRSSRLEYTNLHTFKLAISASSNNEIEKLFNVLCSSTTTFFSIRNRGFSAIPAKTEVLISDPGDSVLGLGTVVDSPLRLVRVPRHPTGISSSEFAIEVVDSPALFKYTGEDDSDIFAARNAEEDEDEEDEEDEEEDEQDYDGFDEEGEGVSGDEQDYDGFDEDYEFGGSGSEVDDDYGWNRTSSVMQFLH